MTWPGEFYSACLPSPHPESSQQAGISGPQSGAVLPCIMEDVSWFNFLVLFLVYECFAYIYASAPHVCSASRRRWFPGAGVKDICEVPRLETVGDFNL